MSEKILLPITLFFMISNFDLVRDEMHGYITRATQHWRRRSKSENRSLKILVAGGTYSSGVEDPLRGWLRLRWQWLVMIMRGVVGTFLRLTMVDRIITSYKANDGYDELSRYWYDDERPWKKFSAGEEGGLDEAQEEVLPDDAKCVHEDNNLRHYLKSILYWLTHL